MFTQVTCLAVDSEKMSKSLGNFFTIRDVIALYHPLVLRWFLINTHYRQSINYTQLGLDEVNCISHMGECLCHHLATWFSKILW